MFTYKSCIKALSSSQQSSIDSYQQDFYEYLEIVSSLPGRETDDDGGSEICYKRPSGYCVQRTAWIHHLLANDFYQEALVSADQLDRADKLERAKKHTQKALRYRSPEGIDGFVQCIATGVLEQKILDQLETMHKQR